MNLIEALDQARTYGAIVRPEDGETSSSYFSVTYNEVNGHFTATHDDGTVLGEFSPSWTNVEANWTFGYAWKVATYGEVVDALYLGKLVKSVDAPSFRTCNKEKVTYFRAIKNGETNSYEFVGFDGNTIVNATIRLSNLFNDASTWYIIDEQVPQKVDITDEPDINFLNNTHWVRTSNQAALALLKNTQDVVMLRHIDSSSTLYRYTTKTGDERIATPQGRWAKSVDTQIKDLENNLGRFLMYLPNRMVEQNPLLKEDTSPKILPGWKEVTKEEFSTAFSNGLPVRVSDPATDVYMFDVENRKNRFLWGNHWSVTETSLQDLLRIRKNFYVLVK